jgi:hypothetical protein
MEDYPAQPIRAADSGDAPSGNVIEFGFLGDEGLSLFDWLIHNRRPLPVYHDGFWTCYECTFASEDLKIMAMHIMQVHDPAALTEEEELYGTFENNSD